MLRIERRGLSAPACVLDLELAAGESLSDDTVIVEQYRALWCLSRINGIPRDISFWDVTDDTKVSIRMLQDQLRAEGFSGEPIFQAPPANRDLTVVICTRNRPAGLRRTLASLQCQTDAMFRVVVVDNGSGSSETAHVVEELGLPFCEYVLERRPGLSRARNRGLKSVGTDLVAWIDDDEIADSDWVLRVKQGFAHKANPAAVCGVMLPAQLDFEAQVRFEQYGGFNKGRGMAPEVLRTGESSAVNPLYPLPAFGPGGNMAFRTESLLSIGGFDPYLGAGTRTHGGEETRALSLLLSAGNAILHWPAAITWHTHRSEMRALRQQLYGYSAGTSAFYASIIRSKPKIIFDVFRLAPQAFRDFRRGSENQRSGHLPEDFPSHLLKAARRGLLEGPFMYAYEAIKDSRRPVAPRGELPLSGVSTEDDVSVRDRLSDAPHS